MKTYLANTIKAISDDISTNLQSFYQEPVKGLRTLVKDNWDIGLAVALALYGDKLFDGQPNILHQLRNFLIGLGVSISAPYLTLQGDDKDKNRVSRNIFAYLAAHWLQGNYTNEVKDLDFYLSFLSIKAAGLASLAGAYFFDYNRRHPVQESTRPPSRQSLTDRLTS